MTPDELKAVLSEWRLRQFQFAKIIKVTSRAVHQWLHDKRRIPGPVIAFIDLMNDQSLENREAYIRKILRNTDADGN